MDFMEMTPFQKHTVIEEILSKTVRPALLNDGGTVEVIDIKEENGWTKVFVSYGGACHGCPSASFGTLNFIEATLREKLNDGIRVFKEM